MAMKHFCILLIFSMTAVLSAAATKPAAPAPTSTAKPAATTTTTAKPAEAKPVATTSATAKPAEAKPATKPVSVLTSIYRTNPEPSAYADPERAEKLLSQRAELVQKIHNERKRLLQEDEAAKKMRDEILLLNRKLASLLESKKSMIELNSQLNDLDLAISKLKPAPPPAPAIEDPKAKDGEAKDTKPQDTKAKDGEAKDTKAQDTKAQDTKATRAKDGKAGKE